MVGGPLGTCVGLRDTRDFVDGIEEMALGGTRTAESSEQNANDPLPATAQPQRNRNRKKTPVWRSVSVSKHGERAESIEHSIGLPLFHPRKYTEITSMRKPHYDDASCLNSASDYQTLPSASQHY